MYRRKFPIYICSTLIILFSCAFHLMAAINEDGASQTLKSDSLYSIYGTVKDDNGNIIRNATVILENSQGRIVKSTFSNEIGSFNIENVTVGKFNLKVSYLGHSDYFKEISTINRSIDVGQITLSKTSFKIDEVTVTGKKPFIERKIDRTVVNVSSHVQQIGGNANDALKIAPGVRSINGNISIAGKGTVLIMINEKLIQLSGSELSEFLNTIQGDNIESLEVITNPPAKYEASGNTGYINIVLKKNRLEGYNGSISGSLGYATREFGNLSGNFNYNSKKLKMNFSPSFGFNKFTTTSEQIIYFPETTWNQAVETKNNNKSIGLNYTLNYELTSNTTVDLLYNYFRSPSSGRSYNDSKFFNSSSSGLDSLLQTNSLFGSTTNNHIIDLSSVTKLDTNGKQLLLDFNFFSRTQPSHRNFQTTSVLDNDENVHVYDNVNSTNQQRIKVYTAAADLIFPLKLFNLSFGTKLSFIKSFNDAKYGAIKGVIDAQNSIFDYRENTQALYSNLNHTGQHWSYQIGLRGEYTQSKGNSLSLDQLNEYKIFQLFPTGFLNYKPNEQHTLSMTYGRRISRPGYSWVNPFRLYSAINSYQEGNPLLKPYYTNNFELSHIYKDILTTSVYITKTDNKFDQISIQEKMGNNILQGTVNRNFLNQTSFGLTQSYIFGKLSWLESINEAYVYHTRITSTDPVTPSKLQGTTGLLSTDNTISLNKKKTWKLNLGFWYQFPEISGVDRVKSYYSFDAGIASKIFKEKVSIALNFNDIFKSSNPSWNSFINGTSQYYYQYYDTRRIKLSMVYKFSKGKDKDNSKSKGNDEWNRANY